MTFEPVTITGGDRIDLLLADMNDEELFTKGESAYAAGDWRLASKAFGRLVDVYPQSKHAAAAGYNAGLALEQLSEWEPAYNRFLPFLDLEHGTNDQVDAGFRAAECLYHLERYTDAIALLERIRKRPDLSRNLTLEAETQVGICQVEGGLLKEGEATLRHVVGQYEAADLNERLDDYYPAQAQFFLGEVYRTYFEQVVLDPNQPGGVDKLSQDLEYKAEQLLSAQGHYLRAMRMGNATWATAAGAQVGGLYEAMYTAMLEAPAPQELDADQQALYREELRKKIKVLVTKSIGIYERTLEAAERTGTSGPFIEQARASLERMKSALLADGAGEAPSVPDHQAAHVPGA
jgi:tetratricopeptide (TPR) repeat protein